MTSTKQSKQVWTAIAVTAAHREQAKAFQDELERRKELGWIHEDTVVLAIPDPTDVRIGSGGATLNALVSIVEYLSARNGSTVIDDRVVHDAKLLILHSGGDSRRIPPFSICGKAFSALPFKNREGDALTPIDLLIEQLSQTAESAPNGLFVASSDVLLTIPNPTMEWPSHGACGLAIPSDASYGSKHGVYLLGDDGSEVDDFIQKGSMEELEQRGAIQPNGKVLIDSGVVFFAAETVETLLGFHIMPPLDACTYLGIDNGAQPMRLELYSDMLICMAKQTRHDEYIHMPACDYHPARMHRAREILWQALRSTPFQVKVIDKGQFIHLGTIPEYMEFVRKHDEHKTFTLPTHDWLEEDCKIPAATILNSIVSPNTKGLDGSVIIHSRLTGNGSIGTNAFCCGIRSISGVSIPNDTVLQEIALSDFLEEQSTRVFTVYGIHDSIPLPADDPKATYCNRPWDHFFKHSRCSTEDIWPDVETSHRSLWNAKLYPILGDDDDYEIGLWLLDGNVEDSTLQEWKQAERLSLQDLLNHVSVRTEFRWIQRLAFSLELEKAENILRNNEDQCLLPFLRRAAIARHWKLFERLDALAIEVQPAHRARVLSCIADTLAAFGKNMGGLRSGPARNPSWQPAFELLENDRYEEGIRALAEERGHWRHRPELLVRAARHYEGAAQVLIRKAVQTAAIGKQIVDPAPLCTWATAHAPSRIDLAGGWTDTPPICYEHGGAVVNMAVRINGEHPITARCRRIQEPVVRIHMDGMEQPLECRTLDDLLDYQRPYAPGALVKTALICMEIINPSLDTTLAKQLEAWGGGLEIETHSDLPIGSGLGTSSILSGALMAAVGKAIGLEYDPQSLIHLVLQSEQIMTTGGGWQDQAGGLIPGIKFVQSAGSLPLSVQWSPIDMPNGFRETWQNHLVLLDTGYMRLARNLLQDVVRRWFARVPNSVKLLDGFVQNAHTMKQAIESGDLEGIGTSLGRYWEQKKQMARGAEPDSIRDIRHRIQPYVYGSSLTGAGGGGFLVAIAKEPRPFTNLKSCLNQKHSHIGYSFFDAHLCDHGLKVEIDREPTTP